MTTPQGTTEYHYVTGMGTGADNALQMIVNPDGTQINYTYDSKGRLSGSFYGTAANPIEPVTVSYLSPGGIAYTDANGNKTTVLYTNLGQAAVLTDSLGNTTRLNHDVSGDLTSAMLPDGTTYSYTYDLNGNLLSETDGLGNTTHFTYDSNGNLTSYTDAKGNTTSYAYDSSNDLLSVTSANGTQQSYTYNPLGEATQFLNARGQAIGYNYNAQGQITKETFADGTSYSYTYDAHSNLSSVIDAHSNVTRFTYGGDPNNPNNPNLLTKVEYPDGTYLKFSYYAGGLRMQSVDQTGFTVNYTYDAVDRLTKLSDGSGNVIVQYTYDAAGNIIQRDNGNGTRAVYSFDAVGNVLSITNLAPDHTSVNSFHKYTYDALGNVLTDINQDGQWVYTYDADGQLTQAVFTPNSTNPDGLPAQNIHYDYDAAGSRTSETINGVTTTYAVNNVNEYTSSTTAGVTTTYQYDLDGNPIAQTTGGSTTNYSFNALSQLTGINGPGLMASYVYDPLGDRVSQTVNGATTNFQVDPLIGGVVAAFGGTSAYNNSDGLLAHYSYGLGLVSQVSASGAAGFYDFDLTGNTIGITNAAGSYVNKYSYLPFGQTTTIGSPQLANPFTFVGQFGVMQDTSNLFAMGAREYAAGTGQFLSNDPLGLAGGDGNIRRYVANSPVNSIDPVGTDAVNPTWQEKPGSYTSATGRLKLQFVPGSAATNQTKAGLYFKPVNEGYPLDVHGAEKINDPKNPYNKWYFVPLGSNASAVWILPGFSSQYGTSPGTKFIDKLYTRHLNAKGDVFSTVQPTPDNPKAEPPQLPDPTTIKEDVNGKLLPRKSLNPDNPTILALTGVILGFANSVASDTTDNSVPGTSMGSFTEGVPVSFDVWTGSVGEPVASADVQFNHLQNSSYNVAATSVFIEKTGQGTGPYTQYSVYATVIFPEEGEYGVTVTVNGKYVVEDPHREAVIVYDAPMIVNPANFTVPAGGHYDGPVATFTDLGPNNGPDGYTAWTEQQGMPRRFPRISSRLGATATSFIATWIIVSAILAPRACSLEFGIRTNTAPIPKVGELSRTT